jgi:hypothetical protein
MKRITMKTLAVVIGNDNYHEGAKLNYAVKDARAINEIFLRLGYDVIYQEDCGNNECTRILEKFENDIANYDASIFYFAGHGYQFDGENYLTSTNCQITYASKADCSRNSIRLTEVLDILKKHSDKVNIIIIDACRRTLDRGAGVSFAPVNTPRGTMIAYSTSPGEGAKDGGFGDHSIYTGALLQYIGRERISVEELFKSVRKTVYHITGGGQTPWEHTSLTGDFFFNTGQLVHAVDIPYNEEVVKDAHYKGDGNSFSNLILEVRSCNWDRQNPAIEKLLATPPTELDKNQQFIMGRNLLQAGGIAFSTGPFFDDLANQLRRYNNDGENHVLNGMLFEIYFNSYGDFRRERFKTNCFTNIMSLRKDALFTKSFVFIANLLKPYQEEAMFWLPQPADMYIDVDVSATPVVKDDEWEGKVEYEVIQSIHIFGQDLTSVIRKLDVWKLNELGLQSAIANFLAAPINLVKINSNRPIKRISFLPLAEPEEAFGEF